MGSYRRTKQLGSGLIPSGTSVYKVASGIHLVDPIKAKELLRDRSTESQIQLNHQDFSSKKLHILRKGMGYLQDEIATKNDSKPSTQQHQSLQEKSARKQTTTEWDRADRETKTLKLCDLANYLRSLKSSI